MSGVGGLPTPRSPERAYAFHAPVIHVGRRVRWSNVQRIPYAEGPRPPADANVSGGSPLMSGLRLVVR